MGICFLHPLTLRNPIPFITLSHVVEGRVQPKPGWQNQTPSPGEGRPWWELESLCAALGVPSNLQPNSALIVKATQKFQWTAGGWIPEVIKEAPFFFQSWMEVGLMCSQIRKSSRDGDARLGRALAQGLKCPSHSVHLQPSLILVIPTALGLRDCLVEPEPKGRATTVMGREMCRKGENTSKGNCKQRANK